MAKRLKVMPPPVEWVEPPISKEEALNPNRGRWWSVRDPLDEMVSHRPVGPMEQAATHRQMMREHDAEQYQHEALERDRDFSITPGNVTGENPGPPSPFTDLMESKHSEKKEE